MFDLGGNAPSKQGATMDKAWQRFQESELGPLTTHDKTKDYFDRTWFVSDISTRVRKMQAQRRKAKKEGTRRRRRKP